MTSRSDSGPALPVRQHTVARSAEWRGERRRRRTDVLVVHPAEADTGIRFLRLGDAPSAAIPARWDAVVDARCGLVLGNGHGATLHGVTPLLAALRVAGVDNAVVEVQGSRITADAGDFALYLDMLADVGVQAQDRPRRLLRVVDTVAVRDRFGHATLSPSRWFRACINVTTIRPGGHADAVWGAFASDLTEPLSGIRALVMGRHPEPSAAAGGAGEWRPGRDIRTLPDTLRAAAIELIGHLVLAGAPLAGCVRTHGAGPGLYQTLLRSAMERGAIMPSSAEPDRDLDSAALSAGDTDTCPACAGNNDGA